MEALAAAKFDSKVLPALDSIATASSTGVPSAVPPTPHAPKVNCGHNAPARGLSDGCPELQNDVGKQVMGAKDYSQGTMQAYNRSWAQ